jgi:hypothetical protein
MPGTATGGHTGGGYVYPFPAGTSIGRTDQGIDANMPVGSSIGPMGDAYVEGMIPDWYNGQPLLWWRLMNGPRAGSYAYAAEQITGLAQPGSRVAANQAVARYAASGTGLEYGWATATGETLARATTGYTEGQVTPAGADMRNFLSGLSHGQIIGGGGAMGAGGLGLPTHMGKLKVPGSGLGGIPGLLVIRAGQIYATGLQRKVNRSLAAGGGSAGPAAMGGWVRVGATLDPTGGQTGDPNMTFAELLEAGTNAGMRPDLTQLLGETRGSYGMPMGTSIGIRMPGSSRSFRISKNDVGSGQAGNPHYKIDLHPGIAAALGWSPNGDVEVHRALGGRMVNWAGWHGRGVDMTVNRPTVFGAGENGAERVKITPAGKGGGVQVNATATVNLGQGISERRIKQLWDKHALEFAREVAAEIEDGAVDTAEAIL